MRKFLLTAATRILPGLLVLMITATRLFAQSTVITTLPNPPYDGGTSLIAPAQITFVVNNIRGSAILLKSVSTWCTPSENGSVWQLYYTSTELSGASSDVTSGAWSLVATSQATTVTGTGITPLNFPGLSFMIPPNTRYRFALRNTGPGNTPYTLTATPNTFTVDGIVLEVGNFQFNGSSVGYSGSGSGLTLADRYFTGSLAFDPADPCTAPPVPGTVVASANPVCANQTVTLSLTGGDYGVGQTYQWESAPSASGPWTPIGTPQTTFVQTIAAPSSNTWYRCAVTCSGNTQHSAAFQLQVNPNLPAGTYTINAGLPTGGTNFTSFTDAVAALSCGIAGPVVFNVVPNSGPYTEQITIGEIINASAANTITFNGNGNTIQFNSSNTNERAVIKLIGADHIIFDSLTVDASGGTYGYGFHLMDDADSNIIRNCHVISHTTSDLTNYAGIAISDSHTSATTTGDTRCDGNVIVNNTVTGGYYGITVAGGTPLVNNNQVIHNKVENFYLYGIYLSNTHNTSVQGNDISRPGRTSTSTFYGIYVTGTTTKLLVNANKIHSPFDGNPTTTSGFYAIYFTGADAAPGLENLVSNNVIYNVTGNGDEYGLYNSSSDYVHYYHNTLSFDNQASTHTSAWWTRAIYQTGEATGLKYFNNLVTISRSGAGPRWGMYMATDATSYESNKNNFFVNGDPSNTYIGYNGANRVTLADWQAATGKDLTSVTFDPQYTDIFSFNLVPTSPFMADLGIPVGITTDATGAARSASTPDIGAYEYDAPACTTPPLPGTPNTTASPVCAGATFTLSLTGGSAGAGQTFRWESSASPTGPFTPIGTAQSTPYLELTATTTQYYRCAVTCSGNTQYSAAIQVVVTPRLGGGTYTINAAQPTNGTNFASFTDAVAALTCGITGPVVFNVAPNSGPYTEQIIIPEIPGASAVNTITFNGNGNTIQFSSGNSTERAVIKLNGADHITFDSLVVDASTGTYGFGIQLINNADSNTIRRCMINTGISNTSSNFAGIVISASPSSATGTGSTLCDGNTIIDNTVTGGYYGITLVGSSTSFMYNNKVVNNIVTDFYSYGIYLVGQVNALVEHNDISRPQRTSFTTFYGIYVGTAGESMLISKNKIHNPFDGGTSSTSTFYGIYFSGCDANAATPNIVSNNLIYNANGEGDEFGLYNSSSDNVKYYHNTISLDNQSSNHSDFWWTRGIFQSGDAVGLEYMNNMVTVTRTGAGDHHAMYMASAGTQYTADYNNYHVVGVQGATFIGFANGGDIVTFGDWQIATGKDGSSLNYNPEYADPSIADYRPTNPFLHDMGTPVGITTDITDAARSATKPDIGAFEFTVPPCVTPPVPGTVSASLNPLCSPDQQFTLSATGGTAGAGQTYQWQSSPDNVNWTDIQGANSPLYSTTQSATTWYRLAVTCGVTVYSNAVQVVTNTPDYATLPYRESFENTWINGCGNQDVPNNFWRNNPATGNTSWRRNDDGASANWGSIGNGAYSPTASSGSFSARWHTWMAASGTSGTFDLHVNCATAEPNKRMTFDYINTSGSDSLEIFLSTDAGASFTKLAGFRTTSTWAERVVDFVATSATTVIRFKATSDFGVTDIGIDNVAVFELISCNGSPDAGKAVSSADNVCPNSSFSLSITDAPIYQGVTYQWQSSPDNVTWNDINGANNSTFTTSQTANTWYRVVITCTGSGLSNNSTPVLVSMNAPDYTSLPYAESFETWIDGCATRDIPNNYWRSEPITGNNSWRRNDDGASAGWGSITNGAYSPTSSDGDYSARFHTWLAPNGTGGSMSLYFDAATGVTKKRLSFDYINTSGTDSLQVLLSEDGGVTWTPLHTFYTASSWQPQAFIFDVTSPTSVLKFAATSDYGSTDLGIDNLLLIDWEDCKDVPVGGTATSSVTYVCSEPFTLGIVGISTGNGLTYQWQVSSDSTTWTDIPGATNFNHTLTQVGTSWYRMKVYCSFSDSSAVSEPVKVISPTPVHGTFTINNAQPTGGTNFNTFNEAYEFIKCGIDGPVVFNVLAGAGPYEEQLIMRAVPGASPVNTVTFKGDGTATIGYANTTNDQRAIIKLNGTRFIIFDSLNIVASEGDYGFGVQLMANTDSNVVRNCTITLPMTGASTNYAGIVISGSATSATGTGTVLSDGNIFEGNTIIGGYYGITLMATFTGGANGNNKIINNTIQDFYEYGIYAGGSYNTVIEGNSISRPTRTNAGNFTGIYFTSEKNTGCLVSKNRIFDPFGSDLTSTREFYGIHFNSSDGSADAVNTVSNNLIYKVNGNGPVYGIANTGSDYAWYFHNTISLDEISSTSTSTTRGFYQTTTAGGLFFYNNIISITRGGTGNKHCIYLNANLPAGADYNNYYINAAGGTNSLGYYTSNRTNISDWRTATNLDANSLTALPAYTDPANGDYTPGNAGIDNKGIALGVVTDDILGVVRSTTTPDVGAYEFTPPPCSTPPVNGKTLISADTICQNSLVYLGMDIGAFGSAQTFQWEVAPTEAGPFTALGTPMLTPDTTITADTTLYFRVAITCGTFTVYSDTVLLVVNPALPAGTYTINKNIPTNYVPGVPGGNFNSFADAIAAMGCGINGAVVFNVEPGTGPYEEQVILDSIAGASAAHTITFNGNGNTLKYGPSESGQRAVIKLNGADHVTFDSLVIDATEGNYGFGVHLINGADSNKITNCTILTSTTSSSTNFAGIVLSGSHTSATGTTTSLSDGNIIDGNTIVGGYYGIVLAGSSTAANYLSDNQVTNNTIIDFYNYGTYLEGTNNTLIEGNTYSRPNRSNTATSLYGIYLTNSPSNRLVISKNRFTQMFGGSSSTSTFYGIYHNSIDAIAGAENVVSNNAFYELDGNGAQYALYNNGSNNVRYYHNTISLDYAAANASSSTYGFYQTNSATGIEFMNNIVTVTRGGTGNKYALYFNTTTSEIASDYNVLFVSGTGAHIGSHAGNRTTLDAWKAASGEDANSVSLNPLYTDVTAGNLQPQLAAIDNMGIDLGITTDIVGVARPAGTPDVGAWEFAPLPCDVPPVAGTAIVTPNSGICLETPIHLTVTGHSALGNITFQWQHSPDGVNWTNLGPEQFFPDFDTVTTVNTYYRCAVTCTGNTTYTPVVEVTLNNVLLTGTYTINNNAPATYVPGVPGGNFTSFQSAVDALLCGVTGPVVFNVAPGTYTEQIRIPYVPNMSSVNTVTFQSESGVASDAILTWEGEPAANYVLKLDSANHFIFRNLTIWNSGTVNGRVVEFAGTASHDSLLNCIITAPETNNIANNLAAVYVSGFRGTNLVIAGNTINNGSYGIYFSGTASVSLEPGHLIDSNTVQGAYNHGIYVQYANKIQVTNNTVHVNGAKAPNAAGVYFNYADSSFKLTGNTVHINDVVDVPVYGIYAQNVRAEMTDSAVIAGNTILADSNNTGAVYGLTLAACKGVSVVNNAIAINSANTTAYGLYHQNSAGAINYYNNSVSVLAEVTNGYAGYFTQSAPAPLNVYNNILSNKGGGRAVYVNNPAMFSADYNMLYTNGPELVRVATGTATGFATLKDWNEMWNWDRYSISYEPAFMAPNDLRPDLNNPDVWAMHGRGKQIPGNSYDFNNNYRPQTLTEGVPDLGAYEFYPVALPTALLATPATPAPNTTQTFSYGTDTVMRITWAADAPSEVIVRRYSGVVPHDLPAGLDSMFFYTQVEIPGGANYNYAAKLYYVGSWLGSIPSETRLGLGRTTASNAWVIGTNSKVDVGKKEISQEGMLYLDRFTGLVNEFSKPEDEDSSSNRGKDFWVGYQRTNGFTSTGGLQVMKLYFGADDVPANVTVTIENTSGTPWVRNYFVPANSAVISDEIPKTGPDDARLVDAGYYPKKGIHITSDVPIVAYAHIYESANSGATMLMPTAVWGYEYYVLTARQNYSNASYSAFHIVAKEDSTWVEINPSHPTRNGWVPNGGTQPNQSYLVKLNKGDAFQVLGQTIGSSADGYDMTGSYVKSVANAQGECHPIAVFSGSTRTSIGCGPDAPGTNGDLILQQIFPYQAWGNKYATAPTDRENGPNATSHHTNVYRIMVKDPTTEVRVNGVLLPQSQLIEDRYYQYNSNTADYIESNKPVLVAQFMSSSSTSISDCPNTDGDGDPEMFYLSPLEQAIKKTQFYRNSEDAIDQNFITLVLPTEGLPTLKIDGINYQAYPANERYVYDHPNLPGYSVVTKKWSAGSGASTVESSHPFTGIVYGTGSVESYGYNIGTLVKNLNNLSVVDNAYNTGNTPTEYTCKGAPFKLTALLPIVPESILWEFSKVPNISPNVDSLQTNVVPVDTVKVNGMDYYAFTLNGTFIFDTAGIIRIPIKYMSPNIERCDMTQEGFIVVQILPSPTTDFDVAFGGNGLACAGVTATFTGHEITSNGIAISQWNWTFPDGSTPSGRIQNYTYPNGGIYPVKLTGITADGCISDITKEIEINPNPEVVIAQEPVCEGSDAVFTVQNPDPSSIYNWYEVPGGAPIATGTSFTATNVTTGSTWYVMQVSAAGCNSALTQVTPAVQSPLPNPVVRVDTIGVDMVRFAWNAVPDAAGYQVSTDGGANWSTPSSGPSGLTHTMTGLTPLQTVTIIVKAVGCDESISAPVSAQLLPDGIYIPNAFTPNGDGLNDVLQVYSYKIKEMTFMVFNQWGEKIYESRTPNVAWDGTYKGKPQPSGVYVYVARMVLTDGTVVQRKGSINLIR